VDFEMLARLGCGGEPISVHVAESEYERELFEGGTGPLAEMIAGAGKPLPERPLFEVLREAGCLRPGAQLVHCCDLRSDEIEAVAASGATVAHCPRSNRALGCPPAPVRELLDAGVTVGLGLDSAASSGLIDIFAEMRAALTAAESRGRPLLPEEVWRMATVSGANSLGKDGWDVQPNGEAPLIKIAAGPVSNVGELIEKGKPEMIEWV
jgi:5-methylthioadenosine/S-adenosylhomocysteine deaminase